MPVSRFHASPVALLLAALLATCPLRGDDLFAQLGDAARNGRLEAEAKLRAGSVPVMKGYAITVKGTRRTRTICPTGSALPKRRSATVWPSTTTFAAASFSACASIQALRCVRALPQSPQEPR